MACTVAMRLCLDLGLRRLVVEGDSFTVIKKVKLNEVDRFEISTYIKDIKNMSSEFLNFTEELVEQDRHWVEDQIENSWLVTKEALAFGLAKLSRMRKIRDDQLWVRHGFVRYYHRVLLSANCDVRSSRPYEGDTAVFKHQSIGWRMEEWMECVGKSEYSR
ncbi:hypothetical protein Golob_006427 [Gossypium lobatum]|uniref:RNase H type-1 domain-containing protein n=1 Tax=Gossypium lobatum TaxID=34289 RepID=A0A7J8MWI7_9ROSI|nr:hypothetical protein [Gossypium lobatum]